VTLTTFLHKAHTVRTGETVDVLAYYLRLRDMAKEYGIRDDLLDRPLTEGLSGGEKKLSEVLQLVALKPRFAFLDEVDSGVDVDALRIVSRTVVRLAGEGTGFLIISHHPSLLDYVSPTHVHLMSGGVVVRSAGKELAADIHRDGFCKALACPLVRECDARDGKSVRESSAGT
jgi:Fe-S cluster assembly ATP-binding protein